MSLLRASTASFALISIDPSLLNATIVPHTRCSSDDRMTAAAYVDGRGHDDAHSRRLQGRHCSVAESVDPYACGIQRYKAIET